VAKADNDNGWREAGSGGQVGGATVWRKTVAEETWRTTTKKQQSTDERWQRRRTTMAGKRQGAVVEMKEQLLYGKRGETAPWRMERR
jgi:hypothetical protein